MPWDHSPCPDCDWCPCWYEDPAGNTPPVPVTHQLQHDGRLSALGSADVAELAQSPRPADVDDLADEDLYLAGA
jgi:hypothetical protein